MFVDIYVVFTIHAIPKSIFSHFFPRFYYKLPYAVRAVQYFTHNIFRRSWAADFNIISQTQYFDQ